ncbi:MAG: ornithine carbamoyltransferase [Planctomycetes bacterium]|nr:ornithine carbamoyltransferase [Planctomycetota bacterium]
MKPRHLLTLADWTSEEILAVLDLADRVKARPDDFATRLARKTLLMLFEKPSLRTRLSFEAGMTQLGGHAIYYSTQGSNIGGKETIEDTAKTAGRLVDAIMARLYSHETLEKIAANAGVPVVNGLTDYSHPCQILADLLTIREKKKRLAGLSLAYLGDSKNNVTHSLLFGCAKTGMSISVGCPAGPEYEPLPEVLSLARAAAKKSGARVVVTHDPGEAVSGADVVYTDSWMSYHVPKDQEAARVAILKPYQVDSGKMKKAAPGAIFMNCLPAARGYEQTAEVIDGPQSVVFDEAENRLHAQKALLLVLLGRDRD